MSELILSSTNGFHNVPKKSLLVYISTWRNYISYISSQSCLLNTYLHKEIFCQKVNTILKISHEQTFQSNLNSGIIKLQLINLFKCCLTFIWATLAKSDQLFLNFHKLALMILVKEKVPLGFGSELINDGIMRRLRLHS